MSPSPCLDQLDKQKFGWVFWASACQPTTGLEPPPGDEMALSLPTNCTQGMGPRAALATITCRLSRVLLRLYCSRAFIFSPDSFASSKIILNTAYMASSRESILASFPPLLETFVQQSEYKISAIHFDSSKTQRQSEFLLIKSIKAQNVTHWTRLERPTKRKHFTLLFALQSFFVKRELSPLRCAYRRLCAAESDAHCWLDKLSKSHRTVLNWYVIYWCWYDLVQKHFGDHSNFWIPCETSKGTDQHCLSGNEIRLKWNIWDVFEHQV